MSTAAGQVDQKLVEVEERHVAARAAAEPDGGEPQTSHCFFSRAVTRKASTARSRSISPTVEPWKKMAPVGQACTHLPHDVQVDDVPQGWFRSVMTRDVVPRPATSQVCAPSISSQTRTQRVQRMQRLWSTPNRSWLTSTSHFGIEVIVADVVHADGDRQVLQLAVAVGHADRADVVALGEQQFDDHSAVFAEPLGIGADDHLLGDVCDAGGQQLVAAPHLDQAEPAGADVGSTLEVAERGNCRCRPPAPPGGSSGPLAR